MLLRRFGEEKLVGRLTHGVSRARPTVKYILLSAAIVLMITALARPQLGAKIKKQTRNGIEAIIAIDISNSMMAADVAPSRLEKSKLLVENIIDHFHNDRIGLVVYAGEAFTLLPITADYVSAKIFLRDIHPSLITSQGTDIASAIRLSMHSFTSNYDVGKAIIIITDGEDHERQATEAAKEAKRNGVRVFILGVGSEKGAPIPSQQTGTYMADESGQTVITRLNEDMCKEIAKAGSGTYIHVDNSSGAQQQLDREIAKMQKGEIEQLVYSEYDEQFQAVTLLALLLIIVEACLLARRNSHTHGLNLFRRK